MEAISIDSPQFALSDSFSYARKRNVKMTNSPENGLVSDVKFG